MKKTAFVLAAAAAAFASAPAAAQLPIPLGVEIRGDAAFPTGDFGDRVESSVGFTGSAALGIARNVAVYGSYSRTSFDLKEVDGNAEDSGFAVGLTAALPLGPATGFTPYVGAGLLFHELDVESGGVELEGDSELGFEVGAGIALPLGQRVRLTPGVGYRSYGNDIAGFDADVSYATVGIGLNIAF